jgi:hypothetical protein
VQGLELKIPVLQKMKRQMLVLSTKSGLVEKYLDVLPVVDSTISEQVIKASTSCFLSLFLAMF